MRKVIGIVLALVCSLALWNGETNAATTTKRVVSGGKAYTYIMTTNARGDLLMPLNFVYHKKNSSKKGAFYAELTRGDEVGVTAELEYGMESIVGDVSATMGVSASITNSVTKGYTHPTINKGAATGYYIIEGCTAGKTTKTSMVVVNTRTGKTEMNKSNTYGFTPERTAILGFTQNRYSSWPKYEEQYVIKCKYAENIFD